MFPTPRSEVRTESLYPDTKISVDEEKSERRNMKATINQGGNDGTYYDPQYLMTLCTIL